MEEFVWVPVFTWLEVDGYWWCEMSLHLTDSRRLMLINFAARL